MLNTLIRSLFGGRNDPASETATAIYGQIVAQARQPDFYARYGVPDTPTGRFEMIVLHAALVFRRLRGDAGESAIAQSVFDLFFADMDRSLRELGVGDVLVPKRIKAMGQLFYGRAAVYTDALDAGDTAALAEALARNPLASIDAEDSRDRAAMAVARYMFASDKALADAQTSHICQGRIAWPDPGRFGDLDDDD